MKKRATRGRVLGTIRYPLRIERVQPKFTRLTSLSQLDLKKIAAAERIEIEVGYLSTGQCRQTVRALVKKGMVTRIEIEPCKHENEQRPSREMVQLIRQAQRAVKRRSKPRPHPPIPIARFLPQVAQFTIDTITCWRFCFFGVCIYCCTTVAGQVVCGTGVIIVGPIVVVD